MKKIAIYILFSLVASASFASSECTIKGMQYAPSEKDSRDTALDKVFPRDSWQDCYKTAVQIASQFNFTQYVDKTVLRPNERYDSRRDKMYNGSALLSMGKADWATIQIPVYNLFSWSFNDSYIPFRGSSGLVSIYSSAAEPAKGNVAVESDGSLIKH